LIKDTVKVSFIITAFQKIEEIYISENTNLAYLCVYCLAFLTRIILKFQLLAKFFSVDKF